MELKAQLTAFKAAKSEVIETRRKKLQVRIPQKGPVDGSDNRRRWLNLQVACPFLEISDYLELGVRGFT